MQVQLQDEVRSLVHRPRQVLRQEARRRADRPSAQIAGRRKGRHHAHRHRAAETGLPVRWDQLCHRAAPRKLKQRVMDDAPRARTKLHRADPLVFGQCPSESRSCDRRPGRLAGTSNASGISSTRSGCAELPSLGERGQLRHPGGVCRAACLASTHSAMLSICASVSRRSSAKSPKPGSACHGGMYRDFVTVASSGAALRRILVRDERKRRRFAGTMAGDAVVVEDRRDVLAECDRGGARRWRGADWSPDADSQTAAVQVAASVNVSAADRRRSHGGVSSPAEPTLALG